MTRCKDALCMAAQRGIDVRLVTPGIPDKRMVYSLTRSYYEPLIRAGVRIYEYTPGFIHAKSYLVDDEIGVVGTINMDYRSLYLHMEDAVFADRVRRSAKAEDRLHGDHREEPPCDLAGLQAPPPQLALAGDSAHHQPAA